MTYLTQEQKDRIEAAARAIAAVSDTFVPPVMISEYNHACTLDHVLALLEELKDLRASRKPLNAVGKIWGGT